MNFIGVSPSVLKIKEHIEDLKNTGINIIITGETGVGKEVVAKAFHNASTRRQNKFVKVNCSAIPEELLESELYGYVPGAFTGADRIKKGKFEIAHRGLLFLDEIGDMSLPLQVKLLHALEDGKYVPLGSEKFVKTDTWVIAATNSNLEEKINTGEFRSDLYYRLDNFIVHVPPLRERPEDIPLLIDHHTRKILCDLSLPDTNLLSKKTIDNLCRYSWPGNVRQLISIIRRILILGKGEEISEKLLSGSSLSWSITQPANTAITETPAVKYDINSPSFSLKEIRRKALERVEYETIILALQETDWNRSKAAGILKISYKTLLTKINNLNITRDRDLEKESPSL